MAALVIIGLGLSAWRAGSHAAFRAVYTATLIMLALAVIAARYRAATERPFWFGFAVFGWAYFLFGLSHWSQWDAVSNPGGGIRRLPAANPLLPTREAIEWLAELQAESVRPARDHRESDPVNRPLRVRPTTNATYVDRKASLVGIGHLALVWIFGEVGGLTATVFARRRPSATGATSG